MSEFDVFGNECVGAITGHSVYSFEEGVKDGEI